MKQLNKYASLLLGTRLAALYFIGFAVSIAVATFIENDFGTDAAQKVIYQARWFEILLVLFSASAVYHIFQYKMVKNKKWSLLLFHTAIFIIVVGAGITRYTGQEGMMPIREGGQSNLYYSADTFINFKAVTSHNTYRFKEKVLFSPLGSNSFRESYQIENEILSVELLNFIPNPSQVIIEDTKGVPILKLVTTSGNGREEHLLEYGNSYWIQGTLVNFSESALDNAFNIRIQNKELLFKSSQDFSQRVMATQAVSEVVADGNYHPLALRALYSNASNQFVFPEYNAAAKVVWTSTSHKLSKGANAALHLRIRTPQKEQDLYVIGSKGAWGNEKEIQMAGMTLAISYGSSQEVLPFSIRLNDFIMDKYPGTNSASSYASEVTVLDRDTQFDDRIFMNHILNYKGYRLFQSSFDRDEKGTYLSVNHDFWGTFVTYLGYFLLTLGMLLTFFDKKTRFGVLQRKIAEISNKRSVFLLLLMIGFNSYAQKTIATQAVSLEHAKLFSELVVQDFKGRMKPIHTFSREILRKIHRSESIEGLNADQVMISMLTNPMGWVNYRLIKLGQNSKINEVLGVSGKYASYSDFFNDKGAYKLQAAMREVYNMPESNRGTYEKELIKIDERLNILNMVFSGSLLKIYPDSSSDQWLALNTHSHDNLSKQQLANEFFSDYQHEIHTALSSHNFTQADALLSNLKKIQSTQLGRFNTSSSKIKAEILLNNLKVFNRLAAFYGMLGMVLLGLLFFHVFYPKYQIKKLFKVLLGLLILGFLFHSFGLGLRWYISGRAPWSNGYESMIYIAWTATLAGILFARKSLGGLTSTVILSATVLLVSTLSFLDPEITPLVPVLKSYWLTIHVSMEAGSYGFLLLGALIGLINMLLMVTSTQNTKSRVKELVKEMTYRSELILIAGLFMLSIGTYLGGIWANESWGRYWGWDAKETWALVSVLVYAFILHMRLIPGLKGMFAFNVASIFGLYSVIMTYYGVNYYLSGLHSYATGDPVPIPVWVYYFTGFVVLLCTAAYFKKKKYQF